MKKYVVSALAALSFALASQAQTSGWESGVTLSGGAADYFYTGTNPNLGVVIKDYPSHVPRFYYAAGVYGRKFFKEKFGLEAGLQYSSFATGSNVGTFYNTDGTYAGKGQFSARHNFMELPVRFVFKNDFNRFSIGCFAGLAPAVLIQGYGRTVLHMADGERNIQRDNFSPVSNRFNLFADAGLLLRADITSHFAIDARPFFRVSALNVFRKSADAYFNQLFWSGGVTVNTVWKF